MAFDYKQYQQKRQNAIDTSKFLPTGQNLQNVQNYIGAEKNKLKQAEIDKIVEERRKTIKSEMSQEGVSTSLLRNAWQNIKSGETTRDVFGSIKTGVSNVVEDFKTFEINPFKGLEQSGIERGYVKTPENEIPRNPLLDKKNVLPQVGERLFSEYQKVFGSSAVAGVGEKETEYAKNFTKKEKDSIRKDWLDFKKENPELSNSILKSDEEKIVESAAKVLTTPVKYTAGSLATGVISYALERADSDLKYTPKTDAEKLIIGEDDIQRLTKQEDIYGTVTRAAGIPAALALMAILENPFMADTGLGKITKEGFEKLIQKQSIKALSKLQPEQIVKMADDLIEAELKAGKIEKETAEKALKEIKSVRVLELPSGEKKLLSQTTESAKKTDTLTGEGFTMKPTTDVDSVKLSKLYNDYSKKLEEYNKNSTAKNLESLRDSRAKYFDFTQASKVSDTAKPIVKTIEQQAVDYKTASDYISGIKNTKQSDEVIDEFAKKYNVKNEAEIEKTLTDIFNKSKKADELATKKEGIEQLGKEVVEDGEKKTAKLATDTATKADEIEKAVGKDFEELAGYTSRKVKAQSEKTAKLITEDISSVRAMIRGEKEIPSDISPAYLFKATEDYAIKANDAKIIRELSRSKISSDVSQGASELRMIAERDELSPTKIIKEIKNARAKKAKPLSKRNADEIIAEEKKAIRDKVRNEAKKAIKIDDWKKFIDEIRC